MNVNPFNNYVAFAKAILLLALLLMPNVAGTQETASWCISVWHPSSDFPGGTDTILEQAKLIDEINPFWYSPLPDGTLQLKPGAEDESLLNDWHEARFTVIPTIFNTVTAIVTDEATRSQHIAAIVELVEEHDYVGIDIDYEGFPPTAREDFTIFIEELATSLHENDRLLSVTVHPKIDDDPDTNGTGAQDWERLAAAADIFRIMTYDYTSRKEPPGPISPIEWVKDVLDYASHVTELSKVRMGLHFYGYSWQRGTPPATTVTWSSVQNWVQSFDPEIERNPEDMEATINLKVPGLPRQTVVIADAVSMEFRLQQISADYPDLGGVAIWGIGGEQPELWDVLASYDRECES